MEKQRDNHIEQNVTEQHTTEQGGIYGRPGKSCDRF